jgi:hypothetical protein
MKKEFNKVKKMIDNGSDLSDVDIVLKCNAIRGYYLKYPCNDRKDKIPYHIDKIIESIGSNDASFVYNFCASMYLHLEVLNKIFNKIENK